MYRLRALLGDSLVLIFGFVVQFGLIRMLRIWSIVFIYLDGKLVIKVL